ncbi:MAG TPA: hypothetical protein PK854_08865 [Oscillospiraceae bacterium]|nr:hypothetical protein [Oscillospiraceae bacterium]HPS35364.1 hypothetical protein [Oscillospiraceae bacterium]
MKKLICGLLVFVLLMGGALGCSNKAEIPARGVWDGRTYTNTEAGIRFTVPEEYYIYSDEEIIKWRGYSDDYLKDVKSTVDYFDVYIKLETTESFSRMLIEYFISQGKDTTTEQYLNLFKANNNTITYDGEKRDKIFGEAVEKVICGQTYTCCSSTVDGVDDYYEVFCFRIISGNVVAYIGIRAENEESVNAYLAFFDTTSVE